jgi:hypothetical protein
VEEHLSTNVPFAMLGFDQALLLLVIWFVLTDDLLHKLLHLAKEFVG